MHKDVTVYQRVFKALTDSITGPVNGDPRRTSPFPQDRLEYLTDKVVEAVEAPLAAQHPDDAAIDRFAAAMKQKMAAKRLDGRSGWESKDPLYGCTEDGLSHMLRHHVEKGDPVDVANFCMMLHQRGERITGNALTKAKQAYAEAQAEQAQQKVKNAKDAPVVCAPRVQSLVDDIIFELTNARAKFPGKNVTFAAMVEEVGELATAMFEESRQRVREEAIQVAVMAMRVALDGDHTFDSWRDEKGLDPLMSVTTDVPAGPNLNKRYHVAEQHILTGEPLDIVATFDSESEAKRYVDNHPGPSLIWRDTKPELKAVWDDGDHSRDDRIL